MKLEVGKTYNTKNGNVVKIKKVLSTNNNIYVPNITTFYNDGITSVGYFENGKLSIYEESGWDIVSEHKDPELSDIQDCFYEFKHSHRGLSDDMKTLLNDVEIAIERFVLEMSKI